VRLDTGGILSHSFVPGDRLGRYELVKILGSGGFASVWRARAVGPGGFERAVAVKVIRAGRASKKRFQDMLLDEARLVAQIQHPNVAQIWEVGEDPRSLYFVMELVDGDSLDELRCRAEEEKKALPIRVVFRVLADVCGGLHVAHELAQDGVPVGLVHRDVSPQNILVSRHGIAKLIDFGIAKARQRLAGDTTTGYIKGKITFMAPEQARAEEIDRRADVWAIGAVAYEIIEGKPPFDGETDLGRLGALVGPMPVPPMSDHVPAPLRAVVARALEKDRDARHATALALKEAIEEALIESELETSANDVAVLLRPYFPPAPASQALPALDSPAHSIERPVSSTIEVVGKGGSVELPLNRRSYWPLVLGGAVVSLPFGWWALTPSSTPAPSPSAAAGADAPSADPASATSAQIVLPQIRGADAAASAPIGSTEKRVVAPFSSAAPRVQKPAPKPTRPSVRKPTPDEDAIE
jgi:serine/threonine protein kinase